MEPRARQESGFERGDVAACGAVPILLYFGEGLVDASGRDIDDVVSVGK